MTADLPVRSMPAGKGVTLGWRSGMLERELWCGWV
jgi:hypothetical protein